MQGRTIMGTRDDVSSWDAFSTSIFKVARVETWHFRLESRSDPRLLSRTITTGQVRGKASRSPSARSNETGCVARLLLLRLNPRPAPPETAHDSKRAEMGGKASMALTSGNVNPNPNVSRHYT